MKRENVLVDLMDPTGATLNGFLHLPEEANALVIYVHGNGSNAPGPQYIAITHELNRRSIATLLVNLLTPVEDEVYENRLKVALLADRLVQVTQWALQHELLQSLSIGYVGDDTGVAFALQATSLMGDNIKSVVSISGHPELARHALGKADAPILLIVGELDKQSTYLNQVAYDQLRSKKKMVIVERASHSFEEPGVLEKAVSLAADWLEEHLVWSRMSATRQDIKYKHGTL